MLKAVSEEEFKKNVNIRFSNINEGFSRFDNKILRGNLSADIEEKMINFMKEAFELNGEDNSYVDFYYNYIDELAKLKFEQLLNEEDLLFLKKFKEENSNGGIYYKLSKESIPFITRLNLNEVLFSTIYFIKDPITIWGNYNKEFPLFYIEENTMKNYEKIAQINKILIE